jgi:hypothetical protein
MAAPHSGQRDRGDTTETPAGIRVMQTFRKLPINSPKRKNTVMITLYCDIGVERPQLRRGEACPMPNEEARFCGLERLGYSE